MSKSKKPPADPPQSGYVPVCAIGASAGGVGALQTLFRLLPDDLGLAYVVVVHLSPDHPSAMHEILGACTRMPVHQVNDGPTLQANCVYVIAPDSELVIDGDDVKSRPFSDPRSRRAPIDMFFRSIAAGRGDGIAVVLTGAGSDGALGVRAIKEAGGIVMVQEPAEAGFPSMPQNAIATGVADVVAPLARLAERIAEAAHSKEAVRSLDEDGAANDIRRIVAFLRTRTGHDFSGYKRSTVLRRIQRRMQVCLINTPADYLQFLRANPEEAKELLSDLLISVTMFFRDPETFITLSHRVIRPLLESRSAGETEDELRAWVVGCATGEEAYSLAILLLEEAEQLKVSVPIQIFATDLDEGALATAREGRYPRSIEADVSAERLKRFFVDEGTHYRIDRQVRDLILFATHSVVREPPFMRLDLITCRNVLIYLERALQQHVNSIFRYGLKSDGYLFLGTAETADTSDNHFAVVDRDARIYRAMPARPEFVPTLAAPTGWSVSRPALTESRLATARLNAGEVLGESHAAALEASAPPSALVDAEQGVLHLSPSVGRFVLLSAGPLSGRLPTIVRPELRLDLKLALDRAFDARQPTITRPIDVAMEGDTRRVSLHVAPLPIDEGAASRAIVYFLDSGPGRTDADEDSVPPTDELQHLHSELKVAQEAELAGRIRHESAVQELRASNEELQSLNEEYRSTAEELETSKEELQSINEELQTVNAELKSKLGIISAAHNDLQNLTASSEIGTLFLDLDLRIRMFTPRVAELINVAEADVGRPITNFTHRLDYDGIAGDVRRVLRELTPLEREVRVVDGRWYDVRVRPYRTIDGKVEGAVVTFDDTTDRKAAEEALRESEERFRTMADNAPVLIWETDETGLIFSNARYSDFFGMDAESLQRMGWAEFLHPDDVAEYLRAYSEAFAQRRPYAYECRFRRSDGEYRWLRNTGGPLADNRFVGCSLDVTEPMLAKEALHESEERQAFLLRLSDALRAEPNADAVANRAIGMLSDHMQLDRCYITLYRPADDEADFPYQVGNDSVPPLPSTVRLSDYPDAYEQVRKKTYVVDDDFERRGLSEAERARSRALGMRAMLASTVRNGKNPLCSMVAVSSRPRRWSPGEVALVEQTAERTWAAMERARAETALRDSEHLRRVALSGGRMGSWRWDRKADLIQGDEQFLALWGLPPSEGPLPLATFADRMSAEGAAEMADIVAQAVAAGEEFAGPLEIVSGPTAGNWVQWQGRAAPDDPSVLYGVTFSITEQKAAEAALRESEAQYRLLFDGIDDGFCVIEVLFDENDKPFDYKFLKVNPAFERQTGLGDPVGRTILSMVPAQEPFWFETYGRIVRTGRSEQFDARADALGRWYEVDATPVGESGENRVAVVFRDVLQKRKSEEALRESEERLRSFGEASQDVLWVRDADTLDWTYLTPAFEAVYGLSREDALKGDNFRNWLELVVPEDREHAQAMIDRVVGGELITFEYRVRRPRDGEVRWLRDTDFPMRDEHGRVVSIGGIGQDVTTVKEWEQGQEVLVAELQHRTRNLMGVVRSMADKTARASSDLDDFRARFRDRLEALSRVQGLLSRLDTYDRVTFDDLIRTEVAAMNGSSKRVTLEGPDGVRLRSSTVQTLARAIHELATNAVKYGALGQPSARLAITWSVKSPDEDDKPWLHIDWRETGVDMPTDPSPHSTGQGRELIERALPYQLRAKTSYSLEPDGVHCTILVPVSASMHEARENV